MYLVFCLWICFLFWVDRRDWDARRSVLYVWFCLCLIVLSVCLVVVLDSVLWFLWVRVLGNGLVSWLLVYWFFCVLLFICGSVSVLIGFWVWSCLLCWVWNILCSVLIWRLRADCRGNPAAFEWFCFFLLICYFFLW